MKMTLIDLDQNTDAWLDWRKGGIGGSDAPSIMGVSPWETPLSLWQRRLGKVPAKVMSNAMQRGHDLEPVARALLEREVGLLFEPLCGENTLIPWLKASFDGVSLCRTALAEIKCPAKADHDKAKAGLVPAKYWPQVQHQMLVAGIDKTFYASYRPEDDDQKLAVVEVYADPAYQKILLETEEKWWKCYTEQTMPVAHDDLSKALAWRQAKLLADQYASMVKEAQAELLAAVGFDSENPSLLKCDLGFVKISSYEAEGSVNYDALLEHAGIDENTKNSFRNEGSIRVRVSKTNHKRAKATADDFFRETSTIL